MTSAIARTAVVLVLVLGETSMQACGKASTGADQIATAEAGTADGADGVDDDAGDAECDRRQFGDGKQADDFCWDPPRNYCAQGAGGARTEACDPDGGICCTYGTTCIPCGFIDCTHCLNRPDRPADCPDLCFGAHSSDPEACRQPDRDLIICYEE